MQMIIQVAVCNFSVNISTEKNMIFVAYFMFHNLKSKVNLKLTST